MKTKKAGIFTIPPWAIANPLLWSRFTFCADDRMIQKQEEDYKLFFLLTVAGIPGGAVLMAVVAVIVTGLCCCYCCKDKRSYSIK